ncbi:MAG: hypothetical protein ACR2RB_11305, partial [Gammaproteobacteria bacterium]
MRLLWLPWKFIIRRAARAHGFLDPFALLAHLRRFAQPSEVSEPTELLRAGAVLHARGLINSRVIQHNLDWVWPYWVERQFDPEDDSFVPRAFSVTHINLTHRNWTAIGLPDSTELPIVDPRGLVTPFLDRWSLDGWVVTEDGRSLLPSRAKEATQVLKFETGLAVTTSVAENGLCLDAFASVEPRSDIPTCQLGWEARSNVAGWLVIALRPCNPEGVSLTYSVRLSSDRMSWIVEKKPTIWFDAAADRHHICRYRAGDVYIHLNDLSEEQEGHCDIGMITAAAMFKLEPGEAREVNASIPLEQKSVDISRYEADAEDSWRSSLATLCKLSVPDKHLEFLYEAAVRTLILHSSADVHAGPYTYK